MSRFTITGMAMVLLIALMIISLSGIDSSDKITGFAASGTGEQIGNLPLTYSVVPASRISLNYTFSEYAKIVTEAKRLVARCAGKDNVAGCLDIYLKTGWSIAGNDGAIYKFDVTGSHKLPIYDEAENRIMVKEITYRFALDFS